MWYNSDSSNGVYFFVPIFKMDAKIITPFITCNSADEGGNNA